MRNGQGGRASAWALAAILALVAIAYAPAAGEEFHWDDRLAVLANPKVIDASAFGWRDFVPPALGRGRSLTDLTFAANRAVSGEDARAFVLTNVAIHLAAVLLAWAVARAILRRARHPRSDSIAVVVAALFALHPLQTEAVSFVSQRAESLASALCLAALLLGLRAERESARGRGWGWAPAAALVFLAAVSAKAMALTAPILFLLVLALAGTSAPRGRRFWGAALAPLAVAVALGVTTVVALGDAEDAGLAAGDLGPWRYLLTECEVVLRYVFLAFWPPAQSVDHDVRASAGLGDPVTLACVAAVLGLLVLAGWLARRARRTGEPAAAAGGLGILWYLVVLAPTSSLVPLADPMAEHRTYLANLGLFLAGAAGADALLRRALDARRAERAAAALAVLVLVALAGALVARNRVWHDELALWSDAAGKAPRHYRPQLHAANALLARGRLDEALVHYRRTLGLVRPGGERWAFAARALANALSTARRPAEAIAVLEGAVAQAPADVTLRTALAWSRYAAGDGEGALREAAAGRALGAESSELEAVTGKVAADRGELPAALQHLSRAVELAPRTSMRRAELAIVARLAGRDALACAEIARFIELEKEAPARLEGERLRIEWACAR